MDYNYLSKLGFFVQAVKKPKKLLRGHQQVKKESVERKPVASEKTTKELLGEMYSDKEYLERLLVDPSQYKYCSCACCTCTFPCGLVVRIRRSHRRGRGSIPRMGVYNFFFA